MRHNASEYGRVIGRLRAQLDIEVLKFYLFASEVIAKAAEFGGFILVAFLAVEGVCKTRRQIKKCKLGAGKYGSRCACAQRSSCSRGAIPWLILMMLLLREPASATWCLECGSEDDATRVIVGRVMAAITARLGMASGRGNLGGGSRCKKFPRPINLPQLHRPGHLFSAPSQNLLPLSLTSNFCCTKHIFYTAHSLLYQHNQFTTFAMPLLPVAVYGLEVPAGGMPIQALSEFPATVSRISLSWSKLVFLVQPRQVLCAEFY